MADILVGIASHNAEREEEATPPVPGGRKEQDGGGGLPVRLVNEGSMPVTKNVVCRQATMTSTAKCTNPRVTFWRYT
jgi:hypothetical protein